MRTLVVGDVHGCAAELATLVDRVEPEHLVLVGDLFTKGPDPVGVWRVIQRTGGEAVLGNHDLAMLEVWDAALGGQGKSARHAAVRALGSSQDAVRAWLIEQPMFWVRAGVIVVHAGLHPTLGLAGTRLKQALALRRFGTEARLSPFWWEGYTGSALVVYGHDAARGLQDRRPLTLGLDTGCVYGGALSGFVLETGEVVSTPAHQVWCPV